MVDKKLQSSMTLFALASEKKSVFHDVLEKFFDGQMDPQTMKILALQDANENI